MTPFCLVLVAAAIVYMTASNHTLYSAIDCDERGFGHPLWVRFMLAAPVAALIYHAFSDGELWQIAPVVAFGALLGSSIGLVLLHDSVFLARRLVRRMWAGAPAAAVAPERLPGPLSGDA